MKYYLFGAGWEGFDIERPEGIEVINYHKAPLVMKFSEFGAETPEFESIEFKVRSILHSDGNEYLIACHECDPDPNQITAALNK